MTTAAKHTTTEPVVETINPLPLYDQAPVLAAIEAIVHQLVAMNSNLEQLIEALTSRPKP
jgi:hypothetical protein